MKSTLHIVLILALLTSGCSYEKTLDDEILQVTIKNAEAYQMDLGLQKTIDYPLGIVDAKISVQAVHFRQSELQFEVSGLGLNDNVVYTYLPMDNFNGKDYVEITICKAWECENPNTKIEIVKINFIVVEQYNHSANRNEFPYKNPGNGLSLGYGGKYPLEKSAIHNSHTIGFT